VSYSIEQDVKDDIARIASKEKISASQIVEKQLRKYISDYKYDYGLPDSKQPNQD